MTKFLMIILVIIGAILLIVSYAFKKLRNIFSIFTPVDEIKQQPEKQEGEVVYKKDDVVVMKGDARKPKE